MTQKPKNNQENQPTEKEEKTPKKISFTTGLTLTTSSSIEGLE